MLNSFAGQDTFDSRKVQERIDELEEAANRAIEIKERITELENDTETEEAQDELEELRDELDGIDQNKIDEYNELMEFKNSADSSEWIYGEQFIEDRYFKEYAHELAEDIGAIPKDSVWPATCIDWEQAADELKMDYSAVEFGEYTYYYRS